MASGSAPTPLHLAIVGQDTYFKSTDPESNDETFRTTFVPFSEGDDERALRLSLENLRPDAVVVFKPESLVTDCLQGLPTTKFGWFTEPIPRVDHSHNDPQTERWGASSKVGNAADLRRRLEKARTVRTSNFDHFLSYDPLIVPTLSHFVDITASYPLPISDKYFSNSAESFTQNPGGITFIGRLTSHREKFLDRIAHRFNPLIVTHGLHGELLDVVLRQTGTAINLHNLPYPNFENRAAMHLAAGHLLLSEALSPSHGLEAGMDFIEISDPSDLEGRLFEIEMNPDQFSLLAIRGRQKAEYFRATRIFDRISKEFVQG